MNDTSTVSDNVIVAEIHEYRDNVNRSIVFTDMTTMKRIHLHDKTSTYDDTLNKTLANASGDNDRCINSSLAQVLRYLRRGKNNALLCYKKI